MKAFVVIFFLALGIQGARTANDVSGDDCLVPAICKKDKYTETAWMPISREVCETDNIMKSTKGNAGLKGEIGPSGPKGEIGPQGIVGQPGTNGKNGSKGDVGPNGEDGQQGKDGQPGQNGENGTEGAKGMKGGIGQKGEPASVDSLALGNIIKVLCPVKHGNKCFFPVERAVDYDGGVALCDSRIGAHLANIYSQTHMNDVMKYIRENRMDGPGTKNFRLGMKYEVGKLTLRGGPNAATGLTWDDGYPSSSADHTNVLLRVNSVQSATDQYLWNVPPTSADFVLCEIE